MEGVDNSSNYDKVVTDNVAFSFMGSVGRVPETSSKSRKPCFIKRIFTPTHPRHPDTKGT